MPDPSPADRSPRAPVRTIAVVAAAALLLWFVAVQGLAAVAARSGNPALARLFDPGRHPAAGYTTGAALLIAKQPDLAARQIRPAVLAAPMDVRTVRVLGQALEARDPAASTRVMRVAEHLSWRDTPTTMWVLRDAALVNDLPRAIVQIDVLARRQIQPELVQQLFQASLDDTRSRRAMATMLASNPPWRGRFFASLRTTLSPQAHGRMEAMLDLLDATKSPATLLERMTFIDRMVDSGDGARARAYWTRTFGIAPAAAARTPYDPMFAAVAARPKDAVVSPFEWKLDTDADAFVAFQRDGGRILMAIDPVADGSITLLAQVLMLSPGTHRIDTDMVRNPVQKAPASWQVTCAPSGTALVRSFATPGDELSGLSVTVPTSGCDQQTLTLVSTDRIGTQPVLIRSVSIR